MNIKRILFTWTIIICGIILVGIVETGYDNILIYGEQKLTVINNYTLIIENIPIIETPIIENNPTISETPTKYFDIASEVPSKYPGYVFGKNDCDRYTILNRELNDTTLSTNVKIRAKNMIEQIAYEYDVSSNMFINRYCKEKAFIS